jgi:hypothetical protein
MNITEPTYISVREFGRKIQHAFTQAERVGIYEDWTTTGNNVEITHRAVFNMPDKSKYVYHEKDNELWHYPINGDPKWFVVHRPYAPGDTL